MKKYISAVLLIIFLLPSTTGAVTTTSPDDTKPTTVSNPKDEKYFFDFKNTKMVQVLNLLSKMTKINFVAGKEIADREVNMILDNATLEDALEALSRGSNITYEYIPERNMYLFRASSDSQVLPPMITRVFKLYYLMASQIKEIESGESSSTGSSSTSSGFSGLSETKKTGSESSVPILKVVQDMLSERGRVNVDDRSNSLVVTDTEDRIRMIEPVIAELDHKLDQVLIEVILVETFEDLDKHLGIEWSSVTSEGTMGVVTGGSAVTRFPFDLKWPGGREIFGKDGITRDDAVTGTAPETGFGTQDFSNLTIRVKALQVASKLKILARPKVLVLDNCPALIKITTNSAIGQSTVATATGQLSSNSTTTTERTETGTSLRLTPHINTGGNITLTIEPRFVTLAASSIITADTADPTVRAARTTMMVTHGQTIAIGGLLTSQQNNTIRKVPLLGDIPYVGEIFTARSKSNEDRELVLFITPFIVHDTAELQAYSVPDTRENPQTASKPFWTKVKQKKVEDSAPARTSRELMTLPVAPEKLQRMEEARQQVLEETAVKVNSASPQHIPGMPQSPPRETEAKG